MAADRELSEEQSNQTFWFRRVPNRHTCTRATILTALGVMRCAAVAVATRRTAAAAAAAAVERTDAATLSSVLVCWTVLADEGG